MSKYLLEAENQFNDTKVYMDVSNTENILGQFSETNNEYLQVLKGETF